MAFESACNVDDLRVLVDAMIVLLEFVKEKLQAVRVFLEA
jgi:hypothetical protein